MIDDNIKTIENVLETTYSASWFGRTWYMFQNINWDILIMIIKYHDQIKNEDSYKDDYRLSYDEEMKGAST